MKRVLISCFIVLSACAFVFSQTKVDGTQAPKGDKVSAQNAQSSPEMLEAAQLNARVVQLYKENKIEEAIPFAERVLKLSETALGPNHPLVANALSNLAALYMKIPGAPAPTSDYIEAGMRKKKADEKALALFERALKIYEETPEPEVARVQIVLNSLARLYDLNLATEKSSAYVQRMLISQMFSPGTVVTRDSIDVKGKRNASVAFYKRALALREKMLGASHTDVARTLFNLAEIYHEDAEGEFPRAEPFYQRAAAIWESQPGPLQPEGARTLGRYACLMRKTGRDADALEMEGRAFGFTTKGESAIHLLTPDEMKAQAIEVPNISPVFQSQGAIRMNLDATTTAHLILDEKGTVIWACTVKGHPLLWDKTERAAVDARFKPLLVDGKPFKAAGEITFKLAGK